MPALKPLFTDRHRTALFETKTMQMPSLYHGLRVGMERILDKYSDGSTDENWTYERATAMLCTLRGWDHLCVKVGETRREVSFRQFMLQGFPTDTLDAVEAWFATQPQGAAQAARDLNALLAIRGSPWQFVAGEAVLTEKTPAVSSPRPKITTDTVERAIRDAEMLIEKSGATSGVDRIHTALHGYLIAACDAAAIGYPADPDLTQLIGLLRQHHPKLQNVGPRSQDITHVLRSISAILTALNPVRNRASVAHPNPTLLEQHEAMLVVNAARTILHYLDAKLSS